MDPRPATSPSPAALELLVGALKATRFQYNTERELQDGMEAVFKAQGFAYERECVLARRDIIDFIVFGSVGVEVKIKGSPNEVARQLLRYAKQPRLTHIVLVTGKLRLGALPEKLMDKPVTVVGLWTSFL